MSLANRYRPTTWEEVLGQDTITDTLKHQVEKWEVRNAYLLCGGAGTGKTTVARILANSIGAEVIEIDGASNNGVDNVRALIDSAMHKPLYKSYKVFIIDEVHMLSTGAFNALLKTLEEPPAHAVFILATTEAHKIPGTVMSRLQRFDFAPVPTELIVGRLNYVLKDIDMAASEEAVMYIAKLAQGGMRAALGTLDMCISIVANDIHQNITLGDVTKAIGIPEIDTTLDFLYGLLERDAERALMAVEAWYKSGYDMKKSARNALDFAVEAEKCAVMGSIKYTSVPDMYEDELESIHNAVALIRPLNEIVNQLKYDPNPKITLQMGVILICARSEQ